MLLRPNIWAPDAPSHTSMPVAVVRRIRNLVSSTIAISHRSAYTVLKFLFVAGQGRYLKINHGINRARPAPDPEPEGSPLRPKVRYPCLRPPPKLTGHCHLLNDGRIDKAGYRFADLRLHWIEGEKRVQENEKKKVGQT